MRKLSNSLHYCWHYSHAIAFLLILTLYLLIKSVYYIQVHASSNANKVNCVLPQNTKFKRFKIQKFSKVTEFKCCDICVPQDRELCCKNLMELGTGELSSKNL